MNKKYSWSFVIIALVFLISFFIYKEVYGTAKPTVATAAASTEETSATLQGVVNDTGGKEITRYGFKWGTSRSLDKKEIMLKSIDANKPFSTNISDLQEGNTYYFQAYAENSKGSSYGDIKSFTVPVNAAPSVSINPGDKLTITRGAVVNISATATDDKKVEGMEFFINDTSKSKINSGSLNYDWDTSEVNPGDYVVKVIASDGSKTGKKVINLTVKANSEVNLAANSTQTVASATTSTTNHEVTPVSRAANSADRDKYPKLSKVNGSFGQFRYRDTSGGRIEIDPNWIAQNIVTIKLPGINKYVQVHKDAKDNFLKAFNYIANGTAMINGKEVPLTSLVKTMDGTFVTRHVNWNPNKGLSNHSWGTAIDINASNHFRYVNPSKETNDPNLILWEKAFKPAGFSWGNSYSDSMHYEVLK
ncbi:MAG: M15 family metallopeptidase [Syntrophomonadaceae bacterium]|nr:M15 family metallopeptidase [Syntrophomonadaceae bacterium]MDD3889469.1 M15 family metallopeptidase [Syntrophomonadaceae bacterium]